MALVAVTVNVYSTAFFSPVTVHVVACWQGKVPPAY